MLQSRFLTHYRRQNHRFRRPSLTKPPRKLTRVHPSDLPLARLVWMVQARLGLHPSALACFVTWHLQGSGTGLDTGWSMTTSHAHSNWCNIASRPPLRTAGHFRRTQLKPSRTPLAGRGLPNCLHDTRLEPTDRTADSLPVDGMPARHRVGSRTSKRCRRRHICFAPQVSWPRFSRDERPEGSQPAFAWGDVVLGLNPYPAHYRPAFACSLLLYPQPHRLALRFAFPGGRTAGLPRSVAVPAWVRSCLSAGGASSA